MSPFLIGDFVLLLLSPIVARAGRVDLAQIVRGRAESWDGHLPTSLTRVVAG